MGGKDAGLLLTLAKVTCWLSTAGQSAGNITPGLKSVHAQYKQQLTVSASSEYLLACRGVTRILEVREMYNVQIRNSDP